MPPGHGIEKKFRLVIGLHIVALDEVLDLRPIFLISEGLSCARVWKEELPQFWLDAPRIITGIKDPR
jgi:hypothetical protein